MDVINYIMPSFIIGAILGFLFVRKLFPIGEKPEETNGVLSFFLCLASFIATCFTAVFLIIIANDSGRFYEDFSSLYLPFTLGILTTFSMPVCIKMLIKLYNIIVYWFRKK